MARVPDPAAVRRKILGWYSRNKRPFPWRRTRDPYRILLSEIMLQQTQAERVASRLPEFLKSFPDIGSLARAPRADVLRAWRGMGYNNRAVRLHGAVKEVVARYNGRVPGDTEALSGLPGIGRYTAHAVACFAHGRKVPVVDVNVRRVLSRIFRPMKTLSASAAERDAWDLARTVLPADAYNWNQALMDFGAMVCTARAPECPSCPVSRSCVSSGRFTGAGTGGGTTRSARAPKTEPSHRGVPRRIWRGGIVESLRASRNPVAARALLQRVRPSGKVPSVKWLNEVVGLLERDGLVTVRRRGGRITTVSLAR